MLTATKRKNLAQLNKAAELCRQHGFEQFADKITNELIPKIERYDGPSSADVIYKLEHPKTGKVADGVGIDTLETDIATDVCSYIEDMKLKDEQTQLPPFELLNEIAMTCIGPIDRLFDRLEDFNEELPEAKKSNRKNLPLEHLHVLWRAYNNLVRLRVHQRRAGEEEYRELCYRMHDLGVAYRNYSPQEQAEVRIKYGLKSG